ncbi:hypothetical protein [Bradyrhizobium sp. ORS 86]|uniref:hypothetical protein n=1 Tax=Bradyrhizobium sp. ORS 86 TaxID=1685970 RepID=UPI003890184A
MANQHHLPAAPWVVAAFIHEHAGLDAETLWAEIASIDAAHEALNYSPPGRSTVALKAFSNAYPADAPRSWRKDEQEMFRMLPWPLQQTVIRRETERDRAVRHAQTEVSELRNKLKKIEEANGTAQNQAA